MRNLTALIAALGPVLWTAIAQPSFARLTYEHTDIGIVYDATAEAPSPNP